MLNSFSEFSSWKNCYWGRLILISLKVRNRSLQVWIVVFMCYEQKDFTVKQQLISFSGRYGFGSFNYFLLHYQFLNIQRFRDGHIFNFWIYLNAFLIFHSNPFLGYEYLHLLFFQFWGRIVLLDIKIVFRLYYEDWWKFLWMYNFFTLSKAVYRFSLMWFSCVIFIKYRMSCDYINMNSEICLESKVTLLINRVGYRSHIVFNIHTIIRKLSVWLFRVFVWIMQNNHWTVFYILSCGTICDICTVTCCAICV